VRPADWHGCLDEQSPKGALAKAAQEHLGYLHFLELMPAGRWAPAAITFACQPVKLNEILEELKQGPAGRSAHARGRACICSTLKSLTYLHIHGRELCQ